MTRSKFLYYCKQLALLAGVSITALSLVAAEVPRKAEDFALQTGPGKYIWLSDYAGKTVILAFILTTCSHCQFTTGILNKMQKDYAGRGVEIIESAIEPMSSLNIPAFVQKLAVKFPVGYNQQTYAAKFLASRRTIPCSFHRSFLSILKASSGRSSPERIRGLRRGPRRQFCATSWTKY